MRTELILGGFGGGLLVVRLTVGAVFFVALFTLRGKAGPHAGSFPLVGLSRRITDIVDCGLRYKNKTIVGIRRTFMLCHVVPDQQVFAFATIPKISKR